VNRLLPLAVLAVALGCQAPPRAGADPLVFSATGWGPYQPREEPLLERYVALVSADGRSEFLVHLGDIVGGHKKKWPESQYAKVAGLLKKSRVPVFVVPGDNEWNDLDDPDEGWRFWTKHFLHFDKQFPGGPEVRRQEARPENFAFESKGVLLIGLNLVGGRVHDKQEWATRHRQNADWVRESFRAARERVRAAVIFAQAEPNRTHEDFTRPLGEIAKEFGKPVLFLHADGHVWKVQERWLAPNLTRVMTDQLSRAPPVLVTVTDDPRRPFVFDRRLDKK
jgi:hypothetical protein